MACDVCMWWPPRKTPVSLSRVVYGENRHESRRECRIARPRWPRSAHLLLEPAREGRPSRKIAEFARNRGKTNGGRRRQAGREWRTTVRGRTKIQSNCKKKKKWAVTDSVFTSTVLLSYVYRFSFSRRPRLPCNRVPFCLQWRINFRYLRLFQVI